MENLLKSYSGKFLERLSNLGRFIPINDESFYLVFKESGNRAAFIRKNLKGEIEVNSLTVKNYDYLSLETDSETTGLCGDEMQALKVIAHLKK